jgi:minor extracellular serine protease Vpr
MRMLLCLLLFFTGTIDAGADGGDANRSGYPMQKFDLPLRELITNSIVAEEYFSQEILRRLPDPGEPGRAGQPENYINVIVFGEPEAIGTLPVRVVSRHKNFVTVRATIREILAIAADASVARIAQETPLSPDLDVSVPGMGIADLHNGWIRNLEYTGEGVIIGIIDTGIDIRHPDFREIDDTSGTRIISIWDPSLEPIGDERSPEGIGYGVEYTRDQIEAELRNETEGRIRSIDGEGHGTFVAGIAGGNGAASGFRYTGTAPKAEFIITKGFEAAWIIDAINYIFSTAEALGRPAVINMSFGGHDGSHDGTHPVEIAIDEHARHPGRIIVTSAGNSGSGIMQAHGTLVGEITEIILAVCPRNSDDDPQVENLVRSQLWFAGSDSLELTVSTPNGYSVSISSNLETVSATPDGIVEAYPITNSSVNMKGARGIQFVVRPTDALRIPAAGIWKIEAYPQEGREIRFNMWRSHTSLRNVLLYNSEWPRESRNTQLPSGCELRLPTGADVRRFTVSMPATAENVVAVGSYVSRTDWPGQNPVFLLLSNPEMDGLSEWSSGGPTRDGRMKPDITGPGEFIIAPRSRDSEIAGWARLANRHYRVWNGTSMSAPHVTGLIALMLEEKPELTARQIIDILYATGSNDRHTLEVPNYDWGYGKIDGYTAMDLLYDHAHIPATATLFPNYPNPFNPATSIRFVIDTPTQVRLTVYDILGREVAVLKDQMLQPRIYTVPFDGRGLASGVYICVLESTTVPGNETTVQTQKMMLLK